MVVCHLMCDYHHCHSEEEERLTIMVTTTGEKAQGEGCHYDTTTGSTAMVTTMQDRLQERSEKRTRTSSDYIIRLTDRLRVFGAKMTSCFSQKQGKTSQHHNWPRHMDCPHIGPNSAIKQGKSAKRTNGTHFARPRGGGGVFLIA